MNDTKRPVDLPTLKTFVGAYAEDCERCNCNRCRGSGVVAVDDDGLKVGEPCACKPHDLDYGEGQ